MRHPTTQHPTTQHPTTQHPTTQHPTTQHPTTQHPTTQHPTTQHPPVQTRCIRIRLHPGTTEKAAEWLRDFERRREESLESMRHSGMVWESAFLDRRPEGDEVLLVQCSHDFERTSRAFLGSELPIDVEARAVMREITRESSVAETMVQLEPGEF